MKKGNIKPLGSRILVKMLESDKEQTRGGIIIPDSAQEKPQEAEVLALGKGERTESGEIIPFEVEVVAV